MRRLTLGQLAFIFALGQSAGAGADPASAYRLQLAGQEAYRLQTGASRQLARPLAVLADKPFAAEIEAAARASGLDPALVHAVIHVESAYRPTAISDKGAVGLMQVLPETACRFGIRNPADPGDNLLAGTRYLRALLDRFDQRPDLALAAYNAGEGAVLRHAGNIPPYPETRRYVPAVLARFEELRVRPLGRIDYLPGTRMDGTALAPYRPHSGKPAPSGPNRHRSG